jgi:perosamine synthetase
MTPVFRQLVANISKLYGHSEIPLHRPVFTGNERQYLIDCIDSNFVSSVGEKVVEFEKLVGAYTGAQYAIATVNGTSALHAALMGAGVDSCCEVITQSLTFVATCNAIAYTGATPVFVDVDLDTMGMSPQALRAWLLANTAVSGGACVNKTTGARIAACLPMHTFGFPCRIAEIAQVCEEFGITLIEDAAESLGSFVGAQHTGTFGKMATLSFNGNKIITTGGGGMVITNDPVLAKQLRHLTTTAKIPHAYEFMHDQVGYNYRMPNLNAALGCAQMEKLDQMLAAKRKVAQHYLDFGKAHGVEIFKAPAGTTPNYWLNCLVLSSRQERDEFLEYSNSQGAMTRPIWRLMSSLPMFSGLQHDGLENSRWLEDRVVNLPSSVPEGWV